jgi:hypothetical protein
MKKLFYLFFTFNSITKSDVCKVNANHFVDHSNVGIETSIGKNLLLRYIGSPWKSKFYVVIPEYRYHFNENTMAFMLGSILGTVFNFKNGTI